MGEQSRPVVVCEFCDRDMNDSVGCDSDRTIEFADGETADPIPFGKGKFERTYDERLESYEEEIQSGGRGRLTAADVRAERDRFVEMYPDEGAYNDRECHDCGALVGEVHHPGCDMEECPRCADQYFICDCVTEEKMIIWGEVEWTL